MEHIESNSSQEAQDMPFLNSDLQRSIASATREAKTLLCFVTDDSDICSQWETIISESKYRAALMSRTITLKINAGTQEAEYLNTVCPLNGIPAIVSIKRGSIEENLQHPQTTILNLRTKFDAQFGLTANTEDHRLYDAYPQVALGPLPGFDANAAEYVAENASDVPSPALDENSTDSPMYIILPPSTGRMRLPNNAYDALNIQTQKWLGQNVRGDNVLKLQLKLLRNVPAMETAVSEIENRVQGVVPELSSQQQDRLLNTPATMLRIGQAPTSSATSPSITATPASNASTPQHQDSTEAEPAQNTSGDAETLRRQEIVSQRQTERQQERLRMQEQRRQEQELQRTNYVKAQRERETAERAERDRIKAQIASDRAKQRHLDEVQRQAGRKAQLESLRQANSTTTDPQSTDIRIQVRTFDGSTIKSSFPGDARISASVRPWVDQTSKQAIPYNLKLILTPLPNRTVEAGEEELSLSDLGIVGSATMVMVPVKGYVDSYASGGNGIVSAVTGAIGGVLGGLGSLIGWGGGSTTSQSMGNDSASDADRSTGEPRVRVRTLADQRAEEAKKQGNELYNGNQLNFQGRKDDDADQKED